MMRAEITLSDCGATDLLAGALRPETERDIPRTSVVVETVGDKLVIRMEAEDVNALRAALNSYSRWLKLALDTEEAIGGN